jgi:hypothetical protein
VGADRVATNTRSAALATSEAARRSVVGFMR